MADKGAPNRRVQRRDDSDDDDGESDVAFGTTLSEASATDKTLGNREERGEKRKLDSWDAKIEAARAKKAFFIAETARVKASMGLALAKSALDDDPPASPASPASDDTNKIRADWAAATKTAAELESFLDSLKKSRKALEVPVSSEPLTVGATFTKGGLLTPKARGATSPERARKRQRRGGDPLTPPLTVPKGPARRPSARGTPVTPTRLKKQAKRKGKAAIKPKQRDLMKGAKVFAAVKSPLDPPGGDDDPSDSSDDGPDGDDDEDPDWVDEGDDENDEEPADPDLPFVRNGNIVPARAPPENVPPLGREQHRFCMSVLRSMVMRFTKNQQPAFQIPIIETVRDSSASVLCDRCRRLNAQCLTAHRAMLGDAWDLTRLLGTAREYFVDIPAAEGAVDPPPSRGLMAELVMATWELLAAFVSADRAYRKAHNLTTDPRHQRRPSELLLLPVLEARSAQVKKLLTSRTAAADPRRVAFNTTAWRSLSLLRLEEGDPGHELWSRHRSTYIDRLKLTRRLWSREPGVVSTRDQLCVIPEVGPYGGQL